MLDWRIGRVESISALNFLWKYSAEKALNFWFLFAVKMVEDSRLILA